MSSMQEMSSVDFQKSVSYIKTDRLTDKVIHRGAPSKKNLKIVIFDGDPVLDSDPK